MLFSITAGWIVDSALALTEVQLTFKSPLFEQAKKQARQATLPKDFPTHLRMEWPGKWATSDGKNSRALVRYHGDLPKHWQGAHPSYRVKSHGALLGGVRKWSLISASDKAFNVESLSCEMARLRGLLCPRKKWIQLTVNSVDHGLYLANEVWSSETWKYHGRKEGALIGEDGNWIAQVGAKRKTFYDLGFQKKGFTSYPLQWNPSIYRIKAYQGVTLPDVEEKWRLFLERAPRDSIEQMQLYLDVKKFASWVALQYIFGSAHASMGDNLNWFFHSATGLFEPTLYDILIAHWNHPTPIADRLSGSSEITSRFLSSCIGQTLLQEEHQFWSKNWEASVMTPMNEFWSNEGAIVPNAKQRRIELIKLLKSNFSAFGRWVKGVKCKS